MIVHIYGFDWETYALTVMPMFADWLAEGDEMMIYQMYQQTRCYREERCMPEAMQPLCAWPRAQAFVKRLPRGPHTRREYQLLCDAERFTTLSDTYAQRHPPQLYQNNEAVRIIWGAIVEEYCLLSPFFPAGSSIDAKSTAMPDATTLAQDEALHDEVVSLLHAAGLGRLLREAYEQEQVPSQQESAGGEMQPSELPTALEFADEAEPMGVELGRLPAPLHLRGWLAAKSVRAMALFELLACGRRSMPFGYRAGESYEAFIGYLMPQEVQQLAISTRDLQPPDAAQAREDHLAYRRQRNDPAAAFRLIDEVAPTHAQALLQAVNFAAQQGAGLICGVG